MSKSAEKLIILVDVCRGLLARVYNLVGTNFKRPVTLNEEVDKVCKLLLKKFPDHPNDLEKTPGNDVFRKRAQDIAAELKDYYLTVLDVMNFSDAAWVLLKDMASNTVAFRFAINTDLMCQFLDLLVMYIQLHLLVARIEEGKLMLSVYARAYHCTHGNSEPNFFRIATYIEQHEDPLPKLRDQCASLGLSIGETLNGLQDLVAKWSDPLMIRDMNVLNILDDTKELAADSENSFRIHQELLHLDRMKEWALWGFLVCPGELRHGEGNPNGGALGLLQNCLKDTLVLPIYRELMLDVHAEYEDVFDKYKQEKFKLSKHTKVLKDARSNPVEMVEKHRILRNYLRVELSRILAFFGEFPNLLGPKLSRVLCALRLARNEVLWFFRHVGVQPKVKNYVKEEEFEDLRITELVYQVDQLTHLVRTNRESISKYHAQQLAGPDSQRLSTVLDDFLRNAKATTGVTELMKEVLTATKAAQPDTDFEPTRLNWYRVSVTVNSSQAGVNTQVANDLNLFMNVVVARTRNVDRLEQQLRAHASLMLLFWYRPILNSFLEKSLTGLHGQPGHCMAMVRLLNQGLENVHRICPEEQRTVGARSVAAAEASLKTITDTVINLMVGIITRMATLRNQTAPMKVILRQQAASSGQAEMMPGYESIHGNRAVIRTLHAWVKNIAEICDAVRQTESIIVYNSEFIPREYLYEAVEAAIRAHIRRISLTERGTVQRPSVVLSMIQDVVQAAHLIDRHACINTSEIVRHVLYAEFVDASSGGAGEPFTDDIEERKDDKTLLLHVFAQFYLTIMQRDLAELNTTYSALKQGFVTYNPQQGFSMEHYADISELEALCRLCGPSGVRVMERQILAAIQANVANIHAILKGNQTVLESMRGRFTEFLFWFESVKKLKGLDNLIKHSVIVGCLLKFRQLLRQALGNVAREGFPFLYESMRTMYGLKPEYGGTSSGPLVALEYLASDIGQDVGGTDHALRLALRKFKQSAADETLWTYIPELYATSFVSPSWRDARFLIDTESHANNVHTLTTCINSLICSYQAIAVDNKSLDNVAQNSRRELERFVRNAAYSILHMNCSNEQAKATFVGYPIPSVMVFIEQFVLETDCIKLSVLEEFFPYTLLRTNYIQMYERQTVKGKTYAAVDEEKEGAQGNAAPIGVAQVAPSG